MGAELFWGWAGTSRRRHAVELASTEECARELASSLCGLRCHVRLFAFLPVVEDGLTCKQCAALATRR